VARPVATRFAGQRRLRHRVVAAGAAVRDAAGPAERRAALPELVSAIDAAARAGWSAERIGALAGLPPATVRATAQLMRLEEQWEASPAPPDAEPRRREFERVRDDLAELQVLAGAEDARTPQAVDSASALLAEVRALRGSTWQGLDALLAAARHDGVDLRWTERGTVIIRGGGEPAAEVTVDWVLAAQHWLVVRIGDQVDPTRVAIEARAWLGVLRSVAAGGSPVVGAVEALATLATREPLHGELASVVAESVLAPRGFVLEGLSPQGRRFADEVAERAEREAQARASLRLDLTSGAAALQELVAHIGPWSGGFVDEREFEREAQQLRGRLELAAAALDELVEVKTAAAESALAAAMESEARWKSAEGGRDVNALERARRHARDMDNQLEAAARLQRIATAYRAARDQAEVTRDAYERLLGVLGRLRGPPYRSQLPALVAAAGDADGELEEYRNLLEAALPPREFLAAAKVTGALPHVAEVTGLANRHLARLGSRKRYGEAEVHQLLLAQTPELLGSAGAAIPLVDGVELHVALELGAYTEVARPRRHASEMMSAKLPQGAVSASLTQTSTAALTLGLALDLGTEFSVDVAIGRSHAVTDEADGRVQGGGVQDNRGASVRVEGEVTTTVRITGPGWVGASARIAGTPEGPAPTATTPVLSVEVSHALTEPDPPAPARLPEGQDRTPDLPAHVVTDVHGFDELVAKVDAAARALLPGLGPHATEDVRTLLSGELPGRLAKAANDPDGLPLGMLRDDDGTEVMAVERRVTVARGPATGSGEGDPVSTPVGTASGDEKTEDLLVGFSKAGTTESRSRSGRVSLSVPVLGVGLPLSGLLALLGAGSPAVVVTAVAGLAALVLRMLGLHLTIAVARPWGRSVSLGVYQESIHPKVLRSPSSEGHELQVRISVVLTPLRGPGRGESATIEHDVRVVARMSEFDAYRYGLTIDADAVRENADGSVSVRGQLDPGPPPGRSGEYPRFLGAGPDQIRGEGMGQVKVHGTAAVRAAVEAQLRDKWGLLASDDRTTWSRDPATLLQLENRRRVQEHLSDDRVGVGRDQAEQGYQVTDLWKRGALGVPRRYQLRTWLVRVAEPRYRGFGPTSVVLGLDIESDTSSASRSRSRGFGLSVALGRRFPGDAAEAEDPAPATASVEVGYAYERGTSTGSSVGNTGNVVSLVESVNDTAVFDAEYVLVAELVLPDGRVARLTDGREDPVRAELMHPTDLLPVDPAGPLTDPFTHAEWTDTPVLSLYRSDPYAVDAGDLATAIERQLPDGVRLDAATRQKLVESVSVEKVRASLLELLTGELRFTLRARTALGAPLDAVVALRGRAGRSRPVALLDMVHGFINFTMGALGSNRGRSSTHRWSGSLGGALTGGDGDSVGGNPSGSYSRSSGVAAKLLRIFGNERLAVEIGKQVLYLLRFSTEVEVVVDGAASSATVPGTAALLLPERDVLQRYAAGEPGVAPLELIADAVERTLHGHRDGEGPTHYDLQLDERLLISLYARYARDRGRIPPEERRGLVAAHTPEQLATRLRGLPQVRGRADALPLGQVVRVAGRVVGEQVEAPLAEQFRTGMAESAFDVVELSPQSADRFTTRDGKRPQLVDQIVLPAVLGAIEELAPGLTDRETTIYTALRQLFAGTRWRGHVERMLTPDGMLSSFEVPTGGTLFDGARHRHLNVQVLMRFGDRFEVVGQDDSVLLIWQLYGYQQWAEGANRGKGVGGTGGVSGSGAISGNGSLSTGVAGTWSTEIVRQLTDLRGIGSFDGVERVRHDVELTLRVWFSDTPLGRPVQVGRRAAAHEVSISGSAVRLVPDGLARPTPVTTDRQPGGRPDSRLLSGMRLTAVPPQSLVDLRAAGVSAPGTGDPRGNGPDTVVPVGRPHRAGTWQLAREVLAELVERRLMTKAEAKQRLYEVYLALESRTLSAFAHPLASSAGLRIHQLAAPSRRRGTRVLDLLLRTELYEEEVVAGSRPNLEVRTVLRYMGLAGHGRHANTPHPLTRTVHVDEPGSGVGITMSSGAQDGHGAGGLTGLREEQSLFEKGAVSTSRGRYVLHFDVVDAERRWLRRPRSATLRTTGTGTGYLDAFDDDLARGRRHPWEFDIDPGHRIERTGRWFSRIRGGTTPTFPGPLTGEGPDQQVGGSSYGGVGGPLAARIAAEHVQALGRALGAVHRGDQLLVFRWWQLAWWLWRDGLGIRTALSLAWRVPAFAWRDVASGTELIAVSTRLLRRSDLDAVIEHERGHLDGTWERLGPRAHDADVARLTRGSGTRESPLRMRIRMDIAGTGGDRDGRVGTPAAAPLGLVKGGAPWIRGLGAAIAIVAVVVIAVLGNGLAAGMGGAAMGALWWPRRAADVEMPEPVLASLARTAEPWLGSESGELVEERARALAGLIDRVLRAEESEYASLGEVELVQAKVDLPAGLQVQAVGATSTTAYLEVVIRTGEKGRRSVWHVYPTTSEVSLLRDPREHGVSLTRGGRVVGLGWPVSANDVIVLRAGSGPAEPTEHGVDHVQVAGVYQPSEGRIPVAVLHVPGLQAPLLAYAKERSRRDQRLLVVAVQDGRRVLFPAPVRLSHADRITLLAPVDETAVGGLVFDDLALLVGVVTEVDSANGVVTVLPHRLLSPVVSAARAHARAAGWTGVYRALDQVERLLAGVDATSRPSGDELVRVRSALRYAAEELSADRARDAEEHQAEMNRMIGLGRRWWRLVGTAASDSRGLASDMVRWAHLATALNASGRRSQVTGMAGAHLVFDFVELAPRLGDPDDWPLHVFHDFDPDAFRRTLAELTSPPDPLTVADLGYLLQNARRNLEVVRGRLHPARAGALAELLAGWSVWAEPPAELSAFLEDELAGGRDRFAVPVLAVTAHLLRLVHTHRDRTTDEYVHLYHRSANVAEVERGLRTDHHRPTWVTPDLPVAFGFSGGSLITDRNVGILESRIPVAEYSAAFDELPYPELGPRYVEVTLRRREQFALFNAHLVARPTAPGSYVLRPSREDGDQPPRDAATVEMADLNTPAGERLLAENRVVSWVLRRNGMIRVAPEDVGSIALAAGLDILAAGYAEVELREHGAEGRWLSVRGTEHHVDEPDVAAVERVARAAFRRHRVFFTHPPGASGSAQDRS
jgi:hypothetical protein